MSRTGFDFQGQLRHGCAALGIDLDAAAVERLSVYFTELLRWSRKINLIAKGMGEAEILENHFLDSLTLLSLFQESSDVHLLDVGTGAGFPGLVCKAARPDLVVTLVEPRLKRISFLRHVIRTLELGGVTVVPDRVEDEGVLPSASGFTHITSRAVSDMADFLPLVGRFCRPGARVICMKGPKWQEELEVLRNRFPELASHHVATVEFALPVSLAQRALLTFSW